MEDDDKASLLKKLIGAINEVSSFSDHRCAVKRQFCNLARRLKLLAPMFEEIRDAEVVLSEEDVKSIVVFGEALGSAKELLRFGREASKIYLVLEGDQIVKRFHEVTASLEQALDGMNYEKLDISDEVKEQVELVLAQFRRAKGKIDPTDADLHDDLLSLYNIDNETPADPSLMKRVTERLQLTSNCDLTHEALALHKMATSADSDSDESLEKMSMLFEKMKDFVLTENPSLNSASRDRIPSSCSGQASTDGSQKSVVIPDDFRCPISLELMKDPVIVSTGQTYERSCIEKWLEAGHSTCPKTQQTLTTTTLTPNYVLRSLISQWCEANNLEPPKRPTAATGTPAAPARSPAERAKIQSLLSKLSSPDPDHQRSAAGEIRLLAKRNANNRVAIADAGAVPLLVNLLTTTDSRTQEHAVTALLNLSICETNKTAIVASAAIPGIIHVLKKGSMEARENAAATLFSLSVIDENKVAIGGAGAIPPLVALLDEGTQRGKKDAATALFNLCIYQGNKGKAVRAGVVPILMRLLTAPGGGMTDEALAILAILASHQEGKAAIAAADALPALVEVIGGGSPRNKENAAAVLVHLYSGDNHNMVAAQELGVMAPLAEMAQNGTERGRRKATQLLERMSRYFSRLEPAQPQEEPAEG